MVTLPPAHTSDDAADDETTPSEWVAPRSAESDEAVMARINVRMPEALKGRVEDAAEREGLSINAWLVRAAAARVERSEGVRRGWPERRGTGGRGLGR